MATRTYSKKKNILRRRQFSHVLKTPLPALSPPLNDPSPKALSMVLFYGPLETNRQQFSMKSQTWRRIGRNRTAGTVMKFDSQAAIYDCHIRALRTPLQESAAICRTVAGALEHMLIVSCGRNHVD